MRTDDDRGSCGRPSPVPLVGSCPRNRKWGFGLHLGDRRVAGSFRRTRPRSYPSAWLSPRSGPDGSGRFDNVPAPIGRGPNHTERTCLLRSDRS